MRHRIPICVYARISRCHFSDPDPEVSRCRLDEVNRHATHLIDRDALVFSPLSHGAQFDLPDIPDSVWPELGLRITEGCDELYLLEFEE